MGEVSRKRVLIIDDEAIGSNLKDAFDRLNKGKLPLPVNFAKPGDVEFEAHICPRPDLVNDRLKDPLGWDIFVIDCKFAGGRYAIPILESLLDIREQGLKIVWTAYPEEQEKTECMRLGAWSYLDKRMPTYGNTCIDIIVEVLEGMRRSPIASEKMRLNNDGCEYVSKHYDELYAQYGGKYVAFERSGEQWTVIGEEETLYSLYVGLKGAGKDRNKVFITLLK
jgi:hypothetical protein